VNPKTSAMNLHAACQLLIQEMGLDLPLDNDLPQALAQINNQRIARHWPMVTSLSFFNPSIGPINLVPPPLDLVPLRAFWEKGLTLLLKGHIQEGVAQMLACAKPLAEQPNNHILCEIARSFMEMLPYSAGNHFEALVQLAGRFDNLLRDANALEAVPAENLWRDCLFYLSLKNPSAFEQAFSLNEAGVIALQDRLRWVARQLSHLLYPTEDDHKIDKNIIEKNLVPVTDALLFLNEITLRTRLILRMDKIEDRMLKIAVPIQLLMAEAMRLS
jgi:hypothetical protein